MVSVDVKHHAYLLALVYKIHIKSKYKNKRREEIEEEEDEEVEFVSTVHVMILSRM